MASNQELDRFVRDALMAGQPRNSIRDALVQAGWRPEQLTSVLDDYADVQFPVPVPRPRASLNAREAFLYLVLFSLLYMLCWQLGSLLFDLVNAALPDAANPSDSFDFSGSTRFAIASLIIVFPLFAWMARLIGRETERSPIKRLSPVRRWLTYLTLFAAAVTLVGDLTAIVYNVLGGELTLRFLAKAAVLALMAGSVFLYYLTDLRRDEQDSAAQHAWGKRLLLAAAVLALAAVAGGFLLTGSPAYQRALRLDGEVEGKLQQVDSAIDSYADEHKALPARLEELLTTQPSDLPEAIKEVSYMRTGEQSYQLCATFAEASPRGRRRLFYLGQWAHTAGRQCFNRTADWKTE